MYRWRLYSVPPVRRPDGSVSFIRVACTSCGASAPDPRLDREPVVDHKVDCPRAPGWSFLSTRELQANELN